jgi:L-threonylcarbamoyladenylate synthase
MSIANPIQHHFQNGDLLLYPTPSCWALGCDARNESAVQKILDLLPKASHHFAIMLASMRDVERVIPEFPDLCYDLVEFATTPLTIVYPDAQGISKLLCYPDGSLGIQVTQNNVVRQMLNSLKNPLVFVELPRTFSPQNNQNDSFAPILNAVSFIVEDKAGLVSNTPSKILKIGKDLSIKILRE